MTKAEAQDMAMYIKELFEVKEDDDDPVDVANVAMSAFKDIAKNNRKVRHFMWMNDNDDLLDRWGLDYGSEI